MTLTAARFAPRSTAIYDKAFALALKGDSRQSDELLQMANEMSALEHQLCEIASVVPDAVSELLIKSALGGFNDDMSPIDFIGANRDTLDYYAKNDEHLRKLISAVLDPKPYSPNVVSLSTDELQQASNVITTLKQADPGRVFDPIITPAAIARQARGYQDFLINGHCSILRECPDCKNKYSAKVHLDKRIYWHCPHCNVISAA